MLIILSGPNFLWQGTESLDLFATQHAGNRSLLEMSCLHKTIEQIMLVLLHMSFLFRDGRESDN